MPGRACPLCRRRPALPFRRYWREVDPAGPPARCPGCGAELAPHPVAFYAAFIPPLAASIPALSAVLLWCSRGGSAAVAVPAYLAVLAGLTFAGSFLAWLLVPWRSSATAKKRTDDDRDWIV